MRNLSNVKSSVSRDNFFSTRFFVDRFRCIYTKQVSLCEFTKTLYEKFHYLAIYLFCSDLIVLIPQLYTSGHSLLVVERFVTKYGNICVIKVFLLFLSEWNCDFTYKTCSVIGPGKGLKC